MKGGCMEERVQLKENGDLGNGTQDLFIDGHMVGSIMPHRGEMFLAASHLKITGMTVRVGRDWDDSVKCGGDLEHCYDMVQDCRKCWSKGENEKEDL
jgi:hypothetical protein